jgi:hypothetical protein
MPARLHFRPSQVCDHVVVSAVCTRATCLERRRLDMPAMASAGFDLPLIEIEARLRCKGRGRDGRAPECGAPVEIDVWTPPPQTMDAHLPILRPSPRRTKSPHPEGQGLRHAARGASNDRQWRLVD